MLGATILSSNSSSTCGAVVLLDLYMLPLVLVVIRLAIIAKQCYYIMDDATMLLCQELNHMI